MEMNDEGKIFDLLAEIRQELQAGLSAPAALEQNQAGRSCGLMTDQLQPFGLQPGGAAQGRQIHQALRPVD